MKFSYLFRLLCFQTTKQDKKNTLIYNAWSRILQTNRSIPKNAACYCNDKTVHVNGIEITGCVGQKTVSHEQHTTGDTAQIFSYAILELRILLPRLRSTPEFELIWFCLKKSALLSRNGSPEKEVYQGIKRECCVNRQQFPLL